MTRITVLGITAIISTQMLYIYAVLMFYVFGEHDLTYSLTYSIRGLGMCFDALAVFCSLTVFGSGLYTRIFKSCHFCLFECIRKTSKVDVAAGDWEMEIGAGVASKTRSNRDSAQTQSQIESSAAQSVNTVQSAETAETVV
eukprot:CAMPEP_0202722724 /NCGR_PEP_ID=MMETSP1385-20130828/159807_1 /ASSEMBLY_ACC=CAM_ASM_000861 /TAXON_ID=933848 /ORGANISM="Elphidium margaritaceum" /LENGTH=140 /DNA_ID=CAMNT_0049387525 /DNA_START=623 /DNA_END=1045 /DNA_ORIENTATION=+